MKKIEDLPVNSSHLIFKRKDSGQDQDSGFVRFIYEAEPPAKHKMDRWVTVLSGQQQRLVSLVSKDNQ